MDINTNTTKEVQKIYMEQILTDMENGVMAISKTGRIMYANRKMTEFFESESLDDMKIQTLITNGRAENDDFWDTILDVVHNHGIHHQKQVSFVSPSGKKYKFHVTSSYLSPISIPGIDEHNGVVITISDETNYELLLQKKHDSTVVLVAMLLVIALTNFVSEIHVMFPTSFPHEWIARFTEFASFVCALVFLKYTSLTVSDFGVFPKKNKVLWELAESLGICVIMTVLMVAGKIMMIKLGSDLFSSNNLFFDWKSPGTYYIHYILIVVFQELLTRCGLQKSISRVIGEKYRFVAGVLITTLIFGAVHIQHGLVYMLGASVLNLILAMVYNRYDSLLGTCIIHYYFGILGIVMNWII